MGTGSTTGCRRRWWEWEWLFSGSWERERVWLDGRVSGSAFVGSVAGTVIETLIHVNYRHKILLPFPADTQK